MPAHLTDHHAALSLFAEAMVGEPVPLDAADGACWPEHQTEFRPSAIVAPVSVDLDGEPARRRYRAVVVHQAVAIEERADLDLDRPLMRREHPMLPTVFAVLDDLRIDHVTRRRYPGAAEDLDSALEATRDRVGPPGSGADPLSVLRWRTWEGPIARIARGAEVAAGAVPVAVADIIHGAAEEVSRPGASLADVWHASRSVCRLIDHEGLWLPEADGDPDGLVGDDEAPASAGASTNDDGTVTSVETTSGLAGGQPIDPGDLDQLASTSVDDDPDPEIGGLDLPFIDRARAVDAPVRTFVYDEWDFRAARHLPAWCRVVEQRLDGDDPAFLLDVRRRHAELRADIRRRFARLRPEELRRVPRSDDGDELDLDAVISAITDRRSGAPVDDRIRVRRDRADRDVATAVLVDLSASTSSPIEPPEPVSRSGPDPLDDPLSPMWELPPEPLEQPRRVIDAARDAVALMADALHELGDRHAIYGFSGTGRHHVDFVVAKEFDDRVSPTTWSAISAMKPLRYTRMGPAIRHATAKLRAEPARTRLLIVLSDGYPQDVDYGVDARDREHGLHDTARALGDAHRDGVDTFCLTIDPAGHDYLRAMCPDRRYLVIDDVEALPAELAKVYLSLRSG